MWLLQGCGWLAGGACVVARGACVVARGGAWFLGGHAWFFPGGMVFSRGGMHGFSGGACVGYDEIRSMSGRYASYWNAFLFKDKTHWWFENGWIFWL